MPPLVSKCRLAALVLAALLGSPAAASDSLKEWIRGPVRYIAEREEAKVFKKLKSEEDRALFVERFWARRDPSPHTLANEYRQLFWERVQQANAQFLDSSRPGWMTDRGKVFILYGPPTRIEEEHDLEIRSGPKSGHGVIRWHYEGRPGGRRDVDPVVIVPFERLATGQYRISYDPKLSSVFFDAVAYREKRDQAIDDFLEFMGAPRATEMSVMLDLGKMQEVPPQSRVLLERIETVESYGTYPIEVSIDRYFHPDEIGAVAVVTADVSHVAAGTQPSLIARFTPHDATLAPRMLGEDSFRFTKVDGRRIAQSRILLTPGGYDATVLVADPSTASTGMRRSTLRISEPNERLRTSDVVWAAELSPLEFASLASHDEPFLIGPFRVVPRLGDRFARGETLRLFFEVYGGTLPYRVTYQVEGRELDGRWVQLGRPAAADQHASAQGWEVPTSERWPLGAYRVRIEIEDGAERLTTAQLPFTLVDETVAAAPTAEPSAPDSAP